MNSPDKHSSSYDTHDFALDRSLSDPARYREAQKITWVSAGVNLALTLAQLLVGWLAHSQSLIAHGLHSFSDLLSDFLVLFANRQSNHPADNAHPYGHARVETAATLILGISLTAVGLGVLWDASTRLQTPSSLANIEIAALWVAVGTVFAKEALYRYLIRAADRLRSKLMAANALHTRADAASALVVVVGVGGALLGWPLLDLVAAILMGFMVLKLGLELAWGALRELIDEGLDETDVAAIRQTLTCTPGVLGVHELRTRRMAQRALVDAHVQVDGQISVSEGHFIAELSRARVLHAHPEVLDVLVHIDAEEDVLPPKHAGQIPSRRDIESLLFNSEDERAKGRLVLHYLDNRVDVDMIFTEWPARPLLAIEASFAAAVKSQPSLRILRVYSPMCKQGANN